MTPLDRSDTLAPSPVAEQTLSRLRDAMGDRVVPAIHRVIAAPDVPSPDEGLGLLGAYTSIADPRLRQAILDVALTIAMPAVRTARRRVTR